MCVDEKTPHGSREYRTSIQTKKIASRMRISGRAILCCCILSAIFVAAFLIVACSGEKAADSVESESTRIQTNRESSSSIVPSDIEHAHDGIASAQTGMDHQPIDDDAMSAIAGTWTAAGVIEDGVIDSISDGGTAAKAYEGLTLTLDGNFSCSYGKDGVMKTGHWQFYGEQDGQLWVAFKAANSDAEEGSLYYAVIVPAKTDLLLVKEDGKDPAEVMPVLVKAAQSEAKASQGANASASGSSSNGRGSNDGALALGNRNAATRAVSYLDTMAFSYEGLVRQLEYEGFAHSEAVYGADNCNADWDEQAARKAHEYQEIMAFSREGLVEQLEYEGFTRAQAEYGASSVGL